MSTRTAKDSSVFHQNRFASSPEFERGLIATGVAKRCAILDDKADRALVWFLHHLSHQDGGLAFVADELLKNFPDRIGTPAMMKSKSQKNFSAAEVAALRQEIPRELRRRFPLRGETKRDISAISDPKQYLRIRSHAEIATRLRDMGAAGESITKDSLEMLINGRQDELDSEEREAARKHPADYPGKTFSELCRRVAEEGYDDGGKSLNLEKELSRLCLDPACDLHGAGPWYFADLFNVLREYHQEWIQKKSNAVVTALGKKVCETLDYTLQSRSLTLLEGNARLGKSFSARAWCEQHPGHARFVEVPPGNDDASFFRALARGLGLGNFLSYKVVEIRERVESVLRTGNIVLVLDEAQRLWPQRVRYSFPSRIIWVMSLANDGVPICMVSTPQFILAQKLIEKNGWNSAQLTGRIGYYEFLPTELGTSDLMAVSRAVLPEASPEVLKVLATYARASARYLAAVDTVAKRARYIAQRAGRASCKTEDIQTAMNESVIPSDTTLALNLEQAQNTSRRRRVLPTAAPAEPVQTQIETPPRHVRPATEASFTRAGNMTELVKP